MRAFIAFLVFLALFTALPASRALADPPDGRGNPDAPGHQVDHGNGGTMGNSHSNPDGGGVDKPYPAGGQGAATQGPDYYDGNNGCGQDKRIDGGGDDNNGHCGNPHDAVVPTPPPGGGNNPPPGGGSNNPPPGGGNPGGGVISNTPPSIVVETIPSVTIVQSEVPATSVQSVPVTTSPAVSAAPAISEVQGVRNEVLPAGVTPQQAVLGAQSRAQGNIVVPQTGDGGLFDRSDAREAWIMLMVAVMSMTALCGVSVASKKRS